MSVEMIPTLFTALFYLSTVVLLRWLVFGILKVAVKAENYSLLEMIVLAEMLKLLPLLIANNKRKSNIFA